MQVLRDVPSTDLGALVARWASVLRGDQDAPCPSSTLGPLPDSAALRATLFANELQALKGLEAEIEGLRQGGNTPAPAPAAASSSSAARSKTASKGSGKSAFAAAVAAAGRPAKKMSITKRRQLALHVSVPLCCKTIALLAGCDAYFVPCLHPHTTGCSAVFMAREGTAASCQLFRPLHPPQAAQRHRNAAARDRLLQVTDCPAAGVQRTPTRQLNCSTGTPTGVPAMLLLSPRRVP